MPTGDLIEHELSPRCPCQPIDKPRRRAFEPPGSCYVHRRLDRPAFRESSEMEPFLVVCRTDGCPQQGRMSAAAYPSAGPTVVVGGPLLCVGCGMQVERVEK
jgi:hypothetical protein